MNLFRDCEKRKDTSDPRETMMFRATYQLQTERQWRSSCTTLCMILSLVALCTAELRMSHEEGIPAANDAAFQRQLQSETVESLKEKFQAAKEDMIKLMESEYGAANYQNMFVSTDAGRSIFLSGGTKSGKGGVSWDRLRKRVEIKLLRVLGANPPTADETSRVATKKFVWGTGGHSSTAGHGNFFDESYTAVMERHIKPVFNAVGVEFEARNYAMGGTSSSPETALCMEEIYGADVDLMGWDFGMTEAGNVHKMTFYCYRAAIGPNHPACLTYHLGRRQPQRQTALAALEEIGMTTLWSSNSIMNMVEDLIPDSALLTSSHDQNSMPPFIKNYRCGKLIEKGTPSCAVEKYNESMCSKRKFKASWHQGWKWHALQGVQAALLLVEVLDDAISALSESVPGDSLLETLLKEEASNKETIVSSTVTSHLSGLADLPDDIQWSDVVLKPSHCHPARVPADIRHRGILTDDAPGNWTHYPEGVSIEVAKKEKHEASGPRLVTTSEDRQTNCDARLNMDHKDYFFFNEQDGWKTVLVPNDRAREAYGTANQDRVGLVAVCLALCNWGRCQAGEIRDFTDGNLAMKVNGKDVVAMTKFDDCFFLKGSQGHHWDKNDDGRFEIAARTSGDGSFIRISAFIVW